MNIPKAELRIETTKGKGKGGQRKNKVETAVRITHLPTGITAYADERSQKHSKRKAMLELESRLEAAKQQAKSAAKKATRDKAIREQRTIRTYDYSRDIVKDRRTSK